MQFQLGQKFKVNDIVLSVSAYANDYALAIDMSKGIVDGGYIPVILKLDKENNGVTIVTDVEEVKNALTAILTQQPST